jgi:PAS domain S-box-containing protein
MSEGAVTLSADGVILYCNARAAELLGRPLEQVLGTVLRDYLPPADQQALDAILSQARHEKWDGTGYSRKLKGEEIPLAARIFAAVDLWDALRSDRPYRKAWPDEKIRAHIASLRGSHCDVRVADAMLEVEWPPPGGS